MNYAFLLSAFLLLILIYTPLGNLCGVVPLSLNDWILVLPFAISGLFIFEIGKIVRGKKVKFNSPN